jgi:hypothetical protein
MVRPAASPPPMNNGIVATGETDYRFDRHGRLLAPCTRHAGETASCTLRGERNIKAEISQFDNNPVWRSNTWCGADRTHGEFDGFGQPARRR